MVIKKVIACLTIWLALAVQAQQHPQNVVKILAPQSAEDASYHYFKDVLTLALEKSKAHYPFQAIDVMESESITQGRTIRLLASNLINLHWAGTNNQRESTLIPIRIPLFQGLLGYRVSIVHRDNLNDFSNISQQELKQKFACQGEHWPDSNILEENGFQVIRVSRFDLMFKMLAQKRCDYFPRAVFEGYSELKAAQHEYPELVMYDETLLHYPFPIYFFTNKQNPMLAEQIHFGLMQAIKDGSLALLRQSHSATLSVYPLAQWHNKRYFHLKNPSLPEQTAITNKQLWLQLYPEHSQQASEN